MRTGPKFNEPRSLAEQLESSVQANRCQALLNTRDYSCGSQPGTRCPNTDTKLHGQNHLCWLHRAAADNPLRGVTLRLVENE